MYEADSLGCPMDLDDLMVVTYCLIDDALRSLAGGRLVRQRGPDSMFADAKVLPLEMVGMLLGPDKDAGIHRFFRQHYRAWFLALAHVHRTTFTRQAANLWAI